MRPWLLRLLAVALVVGLPPAARLPSASACSCIADPPPLEAMESAPAVFAGKVLAHGLYDGDWVTEFRVTTVWKGPLHETFYIEQEDGSTCEYGFREGDEYLVYARGGIFYAAGWRYGSWGTGICTRTTSLDRAQEDLDALGEGKAPTPGTSSERPLILDLEGDAGLPVWAVVLLSVGAVAVVAFGGRYWVTRRRSP